MLNIAKLTHLTSSHSIERIIHDLDKCEINTIDQLNWQEYPYKPEVSFQIGYDKDSIYLRYFVKEKSIRAKFTKDFDDVWNDSCVELFISPGNDGNYYNFEFNCIGTALLFYGSDRENRIPAPGDILKQVIRHPSLGKNAIISGEGNFEWNLIVIIPTLAFFRNNITDLTGKTMKANFYKCGDELETPHYLSWSPIRTEGPDFHRPEFFSEIHFG